MSLTPNFGFNIPVGTDTVNLLTQCYPNFTSLDTILQAIKESGVSTATDTKVSNTHQLVRTVTDCNIFRFVATANYASGDLFTVDGSPVTATAVNGTSLPAGAFVINQSVLCILNGSVLTVAVAGASDAQNVGYDNTGSGLTATNVQDAIDEVVGDIPTGFAATAITYDNSGSGLTATDVQDAVDELAQSRSTHGLYELWVNPSPAASFSAQTINITQTDLDNMGLEININDIDAIEIEAEIAGLAISTMRGRIGGSLQLIYTAVSNVGKLSQYTRSATISRAANTISITCTDCTQSTLNSYGTAPTTASFNTSLIPVIITGLIHN